MQHKAFGNITTCIFWWGGGVILGSAQYHLAVTSDFGGSTNINMRISLEKTQTSYIIAEYVIESELTGCLGY